MDSLPAWWTLFWPPGFSQTNLFLLGLKKSKGPPRIMQTNIFFCSALRKVRARYCKRNSMCNAEDLVDHFLMFMVICQRTLEYLTCKNVTRVYENPTFKFLLCCTTAAFIVRTIHLSPQWPSLCVRIYEICFIYLCAMV